MPEDNKTEIESTDPVTPPESKADDSNKKDDKTPESPEDDGIDVAQAKNLYKLLQDPKMGPVALKTLAESMGMKFDTPKQEEKAVKSIKEMIEEELTDYPDLSKRLSKTLTAILENQEAAFNSRLQELKTNADITAANEAFDWLYKEHADAKELEKEIEALMDEIPAKGTPKEYLTRLYKIAKAEKSEVSSKEKLVKKINSNKEDPDVNLKGSNSPDANNSGKAMSLDDAIALAQRAIKEK